MMNGRLDISPHLCVGFLFLVLHPVRRLPSHTTCAHTQLVHTPLAHTQLAHTQLVTPLLITPLVTPLLVHTQLVFTLLVHTQLSITPLVFTLLVHTQLCPHTTCHHTTCQKLSDIHLHFVWQAWHLMTWILVTLRGRHGTYGSGLALVLRLVPRRRCDAAAFCVAGVALCDIHFHFVWQAWHLMTWIVTLRGRRGTLWHPPSLCVAGVALDDMDCYFAWQAWHLRLWVGSGVALGSQAALWRRNNLRGRRGTLWHPPSLCVAGVALDDMDCYFAWQAWHLWHWAGSGGALGSQAALWRRGVLRGRRGTLWHPPSLCVAGVALDDMDCYFAWQAWHLRLWVGSGVVLGSQAALWRRGVLRGRRGALWHPPSLCVASVTLDDMDCYFAWQAWHFVTSTFTLCGRRGTWWHGLLLCMAGVALTALGWLWCCAWFPGGAVTPRQFAWQAWHFVTPTFTLCGRRGTWWHGLLLCVAGVALTALGWLWCCAWFPGGAVTPRQFASQAWHFVTSTFTLCGRRGAWWYGLLLCVAGVALMALGWLWCCAWFPGGAVTPRRFAWQAWHFVTSTFTLCGRRGAWWYGLLLCVAGVALMALGWLWCCAWFPGGAVTPRRFAWQSWHLETSTFVSRGMRGTWCHRLGMYLCCITCTFAYTVTCLCWVRLSYLRHL